MRLGNLAVAAQKVRPFKVPMLVVMISALVALLFTIATQSPASMPPRPAEEARLIQDEHALVAELVRNHQAAVAAERLALRRSQAEMRAVASAEPAAPVAEVAPAPRSRTGAHSGTQPAAVVPKPAFTAGPPLSLQAAAEPPPPPSGPVVAGQAKAVVAAVGHIPLWLRAGVETAADWAIRPVKALAKLPERHFL